MVENITDGGNKAYSVYLYGNFYRVEFDDENKPLITRNINIELHNEHELWKEILNETEYFIKGEQHV